MYSESLNMHMRRTVVCDGNVEIMYIVKFVKCLSMLILCLKANSLSHLSLYLVILWPVERISEV
jgi:hypothetical protein